MSRYRFAAGLVAIAAVGVACGDDPPPPAVLPNPAGIASLMSEASAAVNTTPMQSLGALTLPLTAFGVNLTTLAGPLMGKTIEWNVTTDVVDTTTRAGAPANATRVILYSINPLTLKPIEPLVEVGYVDLFPHSDFPDSSSVRFLVTRTGTGAGVVGDFLGHAHDNATDAAQVNGFITNGTERLDFILPYTLVANNFTLMSAPFDLTAPATRIYHRSFLPKLGDSSVAAEVSFPMAPDSVVHRSFLTVSAAGAITGSIEVSLRGGVLFGTGTVGATGTTLRGPGGRALTAEESAAINGMHGLAGQLALFVQFPVLRLYGCGC